MSASARARVSPPTSPDSSSQSFWDTQAWARFKLWAGVKDFTFSQGALGHMLVKPTTVGTNLDLEHLEELPGVGLVHCWIQPGPRKLGSVVPLVQARDSVCALRKEV